MLSNYPKIIQLLTQCTSQNVSEAQNKLTQLCLQDDQTLICLQQVLKDPTIQNHVYTIATSVINAVYGAYVSEYSQSYNLQYFTRLLTDAHIAPKNKKQLSRALMYCLENCDEEFIGNWRKFMVEMLGNQDLYFVGLLLLNSFSCSQGNSGVGCSIDAKCFDFTMEIVCRGFDRGMSYEQMLYVFDSWRTFLDYILYSKPRSYKKLIKNMSQSQNFIKALNHTQRTLSTGQGCLYLNPQSLDLQQIIQLKKSSLQLHKTLLSFITTHTKQNHEQYTLFQYTGMNIQLFVNSLCYAASHADCRQIYDLDDTLIQIVQILKVMMESNPVIMSRSWRYILHYIMFPLMAVDRQELEDFQQNTNSYVEVSEDLCEKQLMGTLKSQVANFMQKMCDFSQQIYQLNPQIPNPNPLNPHLPNPSPLNSLSSKISQYIINFCIASLKHNLSMQFIKKNQYLLGQCVPQDAQPLSIQSAFMLLSVFSYSLEYFQMEIEEIRVVLFSEVMGALPPLERARVYTFLAYNYQDIFCRNNSQWMASIQFWLQMALKQQHHPTVTYCAIDFITNSLQHLYSQQTILQLSKKISTTKTPNFWPLLKKCLYLFLPRISASTLRSIITHTYQRINNQLQAQMNQQIKITYVITSLLQMLRIIAERGDILWGRGDGEMGEIKDLVWEVRLLYEVGIGGYFEDQVVKIINCFLFFAKDAEIQTQMEKFFDPFLREFVKGDYQETHYYIAFNHFIMKGRFQTNIIPIFKTLISSLAYFLSPQTPQSHRKKLPIAHTLLLLQNILARHGGQFPTQAISQIIPYLSQLYPKKLPTSKQYQKSKIIIFDRGLLARCLNLEFLCYMYTREQIIMTRIVRFHDLKIYYSYEVSVFIDCIALQIFVQKQFENIIDMLSMGIRIIYGYVEMEKEKKIEEDRKRNAELEEGDQESRIDEEKSGKKESLKIRIKRIEDYEVILASITTPFSKPGPKILGTTKNIKDSSDVRRSYLQLLIKLRNSNEALFESIIHGFSDDIKLKLQQISNHKIDQIASGNMNTSPPTNPTTRKIYKVVTIKPSLLQQQQSPTTNPSQHEKLQQMEYEQNSRNYQRNLDEDDGDDDDDDSSNGEQPRLSKMRIAQKKKFAKKKKIMEKKGQCCETNGNDNGNGNQQENGYGYGNGNGYGHGHGESQF